MMKRSTLTTAVLAFGAAILANAPAQAGILDGTLNNLSALTNVSPLNTAISSDSQSVENNNANTRSDGLLNNSIGLLG